MVKSAPTNNKYQKAFFPTMYEFLLKNQKMALRLAAGAPKWGRKVWLLPFGKGIEVRATIDEAELFG